MASSPPRQGSGRVTKPSDFPAVTPRDGQPGHDFTLQAVLEMQRALSSLETKVDRLLDDRKEDRAEYKADVERLRSDFKEFRSDDFKPLRDDVNSLKIKWARIVGAAGVVGALASIAIEYVKAHLPG